MKHTPKTPSQRLEYLRGELRAERISQGELLELQSLAKYIAPDDVELLEAAGMPEASQPAQHTPLPWQVITSPQTVAGVTHSGPDLRKGWPRIIGPDGCLCVTASATEWRPAHANAEFICRAVNSHADLLAALRGALRGFEDIAAGREDARSLALSCADCARAAIAKAESQK